jgi:two-component system sensor histidine kinase KdpD
MKLANQLGAEIVTVPAENISDALVTFATKNHVKHAVFGKSRRSPIMDLFKGSVILDFIHDSVGIDVHIVTTTGDDGDVPSTPHT